MSDTDGDSESADRSSTTDPFGTVLRATLGPFGAALGGVVDSDRVALTVSLGTDRPTGDGDDDMDDATTIAIEDTDESDGGDAESDDDTASDGRTGGDVGTDDGTASDDRA